MDKTNKTNRLYITSRVYAEIHSICPNNCSCKNLIEIRMEAGKGLGIVQCDDCGRRYSVEVSHKPINYNVFVGDVDG